MFPYAIDLENISFSYENHIIINNLSLKVKPGEHIGIVGDSGCGKSTLLKIIAGLYPPDSGTIAIAGAHFPEKIRKQVALVMQGNSLFPLSIRDNTPAVILLPMRWFGQPVRVQVSQNGLPNFQMA